MLPVLFCFCYLKQKIGKKDGAAVLVGVAS